MRLFYAPGAVSLASHIALREAGLNFELEKVDCSAQKTESGRDYAEINPGGFVPSLMLPDGQILTETAAILQYVADRAPQSRLAPALGTLERYRLMELLNFIATEIYKLYFGFGEAKDVAAVVAKMSRRHDQLDKRMAGRDYLMGRDFTVADAYLFTTMTWAPLVQFDLKPFPNLLALQARIAARSSVQQSLEIEGPMEH